MKILYSFFIFIVITNTTFAQLHQCTLLSDVCCAEENAEEFVMMEADAIDFSRSNSAKVFVKQVPLVQYNGVKKFYPLELGIETSQGLDNVSLVYFDFEAYENKESILLDDGNGFDKIAGDGIYTSVEEVLQSRDLRFNESIRHYSLLSGTVTLEFTDGGSEEFKVKHDACTIDEEIVKLDTNIAVKNISNFYYTDNVAVYVQDQEYSRNMLNYPYRDIQDEFENIWANYEKPITVFSTFTESNDGDIRFQTIAGPPGDYIINTSSAGMTTAYPMHHEINHFWMYPGRFAITVNHLRYIELPQSGFGYDCYNGVFTEIYEEDGQVKTKVEKANNPHDYYFNNMELNLMGVFPIDSVNFPIKYFDRNSGLPTDCNRTFKTLSDGSIDFITEEIYSNYVSSRNLLDVSNGLELKFVFLSDRQLTKEEYALLDYLVLNYEALFETSTRGYVDLQPELYPINTTSSNNLNNKMEEVMLYPNPTKGQVTINLNTKAQCKLSIFNITGRRFTSNLLQNEQNTIDVSYLPSGIYVLRFLMDDQTQYVKRLVKH